ncbi:hypothetical protein PanWU01x14_254050 [Parasponia andersonii]|uniref:Uncharacterized protein n=1 Tax=Parasponia andersonii TaxID=3476 RepID=A0A2P5BBE4_PARAD|nr:hypothetical protein PanWU01x14_254050 [Parasponia andersonii]
MEKGENLSNSPSACEKVFTCILCCNCQTNQDISDHQQDHKPAPGASNLSHPTQNHAGKTSDVQPESQKAEAEKYKLELPPKAKVAVDSSEPDVKHDGEKSDVGKNDLFSDYIHQAKMKIRAVSNLGSGKTASEADDIHDTEKDNSAKDGFSDYINRAKMMIRKTSSAGRRKSNSLKRE